MIIHAQVMFQDEWFQSSQLLRMLFHRPWHPPKSLESSMNLHRTCMVFICFYDYTSFYLLNCWSFLDALFNKCPSCPPSKDCPSWRLFCMLSTLQSHTWSERSSAIQDRQKHRCYLSVSQEDARNLHWYPQVLQTQSILQIFPAPRTFCGNLSPA